MAAPSSWYERVAVALSESDEARRAIAAAPARRRRPALILAALHDLALAGRAPALAAAYAAADGDAAARAALDTLLRMTDEVVVTAGRRRLRPDETGRYAVLYPAIAEAARRAGADAVGLIDVGRSAGLNLTVDRVGITYSDGRSLGDPSSPLQLSCSLVGDRPIPARTLPAVVARVAVDPDPIDVTDPDGARWLRACVPPDEPDRLAGLEAALALAAADPPLLLQGDVVEALPDAIDRVPADALPVVTTTWALSQLSSSAGCGSSSASAQRPPAGRWRGCRRRGRVSRPRSRRSAIDAPSATASSASRSSTDRPCAPRPSAAAGHAAACWRG